MGIRRGIAVTLVVALAVLTGCRNDAPQTQEGASGVKFDVGVTKEPCPAAVDQTKGCIYLGSISDLTEGPFKALGVPITASQKAFWQRVNSAGGIGGFEVDVTKFVKDNKYNPQIHNEVYAEIKPDVLGLTQTLGSPTTTAILGDLKSSGVIGVPASWTSAWAFEDVILESGTNYCFESMNSVDFGAETLQAKSVAAVHFPGDYGDDAAAGTKVAAAANGMTFTDIPTAPGQENQGAAIQKLIAAKPDLVILSTGPTEAATIVGGAAQNGFKGQFIGSSPTWNPALLKSPAAPALTALYRQSGPWAPYGTDTAGHKALAAALDPATFKAAPNDGYTAGWVWSYPLKAALQKAVDAKDLTRAGLLAAVKSLETVDYEGMLPAAAGRFGGEPNDRVFRQSLISKVNPAAPTGVAVEKDFFTGKTASGYEFSKPCYQ
ncbi:ABC transporter substrate-binding protein [Kribbella sandramycini]|uniref:ABC transporter substrate-binding protein n=1 Tax=Kribbella sandramycini TaxID=60450 RepID=A0A7Y4KVV3_9ACTN|nr:ABC transporter substrate-binding protein [Kribbella sandramycini]MBB6568614.1 ABC-type branched-subunit amino acid transport system substrate-binding protein [Kribbella sandramycini]NOL38801.1 ABC transporter substrate-binding protein [Kribbella sandramycini]